MPDVWRGHQSSYNGQDVLAGVLDGPRGDSRLHIHLGVVYLPPSQPNQLKAHSPAIVAVHLEVGIARDEANYELQDEVDWNAASIALFVFVALWCVCNIIQGLVEIYRWYGAERIKEGR